MRGMSNLERHKKTGMYWARVTVPADLRASLGKSAWRRSTGTKDFEEARLRAGPWIADWKSQIAAARGRHPAMTSRLDLSGLLQAEKALERWKQNALLGVSSVTNAARTVSIDDLFPGYSALTPFAKGHAAWRFFGSYPNANRDISPTPENDALRSQLEAASKTTDGWAYVGGFATRMEDAIGEVIQDVPPESLSHLRKRFADAWLTVEIAREKKRQAYAIEVSRLLNFTGELAQTNWAGAARTPLRAQRLTLSQFEERFLARFPEEKLRSLPTYLRRFREVVGDIHVDEVTPAMVDDFLVALRRYPVVKTQKWASELTFSQILERFEEDDDVKRIKGKTVRVRWAYGLRRFFNYAVDMRLIDNSPLLPNLLPKKRDDGSSTGDPYSPEEITRLFSRPMFTGMTGAGLVTGYREELGTEMVWDGKFWMPILALWHGFRAAEIGGCALDDIKQVHGYWVFDLTKRDLKNIQSRRIVPLHPVMIELGFLDYVGDQRRLGENWLFPEFNHDRGKDVIKQYGKWFGLWRRRDEDADEMRNFHSFRHTFIGRCRELELPPEHRNQITGHAKSIPESYGGALPVSYLAAFMGKVIFPTFPVVKRYRSS